MRPAKRNHSVGAKDPHLLLKGDDEPFGAFDEQRAISRWCRCCSDGRGEKRQRQQGSVINNLPAKPLIRPSATEQGESDVTIRRHYAPNSDFSVRRSCLFRPERLAFAVKVVVEHVIKCGASCPAGTGGGCCIANCIQTYRCSGCTMAVLS
eukprot:TRINITY_DN12203_c2_g7_i1.p1 TRINITY_DN12203_c2_g7~~TRINITY_DN12203_c2_g7_i1.p1  ORF type:complete len:151 (-),score=6.72 TRINITY_DN12203_c2_g7_i1:356-808(-)